MTTVNQQLAEVANIALDKGWLPCGEQRCSIAIGEDTVTLAAKGRQPFHIWESVIPKQEFTDSLATFLVGKE